MSIPSDRSPHNAALDASVRGGWRFVFHPWMTLLAFAVAIGTSMLSHWQFQRANEKAALQTQFETQRAAPPKNTLIGINEISQRYARVEIPGQFVPGASILHDNQILNGRVGVHVYTAFRPSDSRESAVLVNRGWMALPALRSALAAPTTDANLIRLEGRINIPAARTKRLAVDADSPLVKQTIELPALSSQFGLALAPFIVEQTQGEPTLTRQWLAPDFKISTHRMYAGQWACFSALSLVLWLVFSFRRVKSP